MIKVSIGNGGGTGQEAKVTSDGAVLVTPSSNPDMLPIGSPSPLRLLSGYLGTTGLDSGTTAANVNGSVTVQKFYIASNVDYDIRITKLMLYIVDGTVSHSGFGALAALTNGIDIVSIEAGEETYLIKAGKTFADLIVQTFAAAPFGDSTTAFELSSVVGTDDAQLLPLNIAEIIPGGIRLGRGTLDKLELRVRDNLTGLTSFSVRVAGYRHYPINEQE